MANIITTNTSKEVTEYIPFGGEIVDLGEEAITPSASEYPLLQYAIGLSAQKPKLDSAGNQLYDEDTGEALMENLLYAGFFTDHGKDKELDAAMEASDIPWLNIIHGNGEVVKHWVFEKPILFLMAKGIPMNANSNGQYGVTYMWRQKRNSTKSETVLYAQVVIRQLLPHYVKPFVFTVKSTQTNDALNAMRRQYGVLRKVGDELRRQNRKIALPLWAYSFVLCPSKNPDQRGSGETSKTIFPIVSAIPDDPSAVYLQRHEVPLEFSDLFKEFTVKAVDWSTSLTERIASGVEPQEAWQNGNADDKKLHEAPF